MNGIRKLQGNVSDKDYNICQEIKNRSGLSWDVFLVKACKSYGGTVIEDK